jgi:hypothetical protein
MAAQTSAARLSMTGNNNAIDWYGFIEFDDLYRGVRIGAPMVLATNTRLVLSGSWQAIYYALSAGRPFGDDFD